MNDYVKAIVVKKRIEDNGTVYFEMSLRNRELLDCVQINLQYSDSEQLQNSPPCYHRLGTKNYSNILFFIKFFYRKSVQRISIPA
jgi:hypothetical protein